MLKFARDYVGKYLHFAVRVLPKAGRGLYAIFVDDAQSSKATVQRAIVAAK